jgi:hypothetical protein
MMAITTKGSETGGPAPLATPSSARLLCMLFMVIERFKSGDPKPVGERFKTRGRMLPEGVNYQASWITTTGSQCFQLMDAPSRQSLDEWVSRWNDLVDFDIISVVPSADFWARKPSMPVE